MSTEDPQNASAEETSANPIEVVESFDSMGLKPELLKGIYANHFEQASPVQQRAIGPIVKGHDTIIRHRAGTGKTAALLIAILQRLDLSVHATQSLIIVPTRELAHQTQKALLSLSENMDTKCHACVGGTKIRDDIAKLQEGAHVVVGTPGRIFDMINRKALATDSVKMISFDETDELLARGFKEQIYDMFQVLPQERQVVVMAGTLPAEVLELTEKFMQDPVRIVLI